MSVTYEVIYTDTFGGEPNYTWVRRAKITMPELTHYGYDGSSNYVKANKTFMRELMRAAKNAVNLTNVRGVTEYYGDDIRFKPHKVAAVMFVNHCEAND